MQTKPFHAKSTFSPKGNIFGVGLKLQSPPAKQQCYGARGSPHPPCSCGERRARGEIGKRCVPVQRRFGAEVCSRAKFPFAECSFQKRVLCRYGNRTSVVPSLAGSGWVAGACANKAFSCQISLLREGEHVWCWVQAAETNSQAAVPTEKRQPRPSLAL